MRSWTLALALLFAALLAFAQELTPEALLKPATEQLADIQRRLFGTAAQPAEADQCVERVRSLATAWIYRATNYGAGGFGSVVKSTPLEVNGVLYFTMPDNVWAVDARTGREIWHFKYPPNEGGHIGQRGVAMWGDWLYFETPDCNLISLNAKDGKERWRKQIADVKLEYFCTMSPLVVGNHIVTGVGGDSLDNPGYLESRDPETGEVQWHWNTEPNSRRTGLGNLARCRCARPRRRHDLDDRHLRSRLAPAFTGAPAIPTRCTRVRAAKATTCGPVPSSR